MKDARQLSYTYHLEASINSRPVRAPGMVGTGRTTDLHRVNSEGEIVDDEKK
jgi:hypothetical protein